MYGSVYENLSKAEQRTKLGVWMIEIHVSWEVGQPDVVRKVRTMMSCSCLNDKEKGKCNGQRRTERRKGGTFEEQRETPWKVKKRLNQALIAFTSAVKSGGNMNNRGLQSEWRSRNWWKAWCKRLEQRAAQSGVLQIFVQVVRTMSDAFESGKR